VISLNSRNQSLLVLLLTTQSPLSTKEMARKLGITPRMVRYSLEKVEHWLGLAQVEMVKRPGSGVFVNASIKTKKELLYKLQQTQQVAISFSKNERVHLLLLILLSRNQPITAKEMQEILEVSRTTILKDLDRVDQWLSNFDLTLDRCQNVGTQVSGSEVQIRKAFVYCVLDSIEEAQLLDILYDRVHSNNINLLKKYGFIQKLLDLFADLDLYFFNQLVTYICDEYKLMLLDRSHAALVLDIAFQVSRISAGILLQDAYPQEAEPLNPKHAAIIEAIVQKIKDNKGLTLPDSERGFLKLSLENASERRHSMVFEEKWILDTAERQKLRQEIPVEVLTLVDQFIANISLYLHPALQVDMELIRSLSNHIYHILQHTTREQIPNPLYQSVIEQYSYIAQVVSKHAGLFTNLIQSNSMQMEIGYITMYVAAAMERLFISSGKKKVLIVGDIPRATISLLISRLRFEFQNIEVTGVQSYMEYRREPFKYEHDLVIATNSINSESTPVVLVSPLLPPEDVSRMAKHMRPVMDLAYPTSKVVTQKHPPKDYRFKDLINADTVQCKMEANSWEEAVEIATQPLYRMHKIEHRYILSIKEIIRTSGPYMVIWPGVVLLHALPEDGVREFCMSLTTFRTPVYFGHESHDPVEIAIVLGAIDKASHLPALFDLNELIQNESAKERLINTFHKSRILSVISAFDFTH
jgi:transcriptional antiterminator/mannitol/fructose-specific phosphotransferase system IIA component (Ntr-type)